MAEFIAAAGDWLAAHTSIDSAQRRAIAQLAPTLCADVLAADPPVVAISGAPGTGKSTLAHACAAALESCGVCTIVLSLDDYYLPARERRELAGREHPLFAVRGVPGTHDVRLLVEHLAALRDPDHATLELPRFDKYLDDRVENLLMVEAGFRPECIFVEGWILGVPAQDDSELGSPLNELEAERDTDGTWRRKVNEHLRDYHAALGTLLGVRWYLQAPGWDRVVEWRWRQERDADRRRFTNRSEVAEFLEHYQRLCTHMAATCEQWADRVVKLSQDHVPTLRRTA